MSSDFMMNIWGEGFKPEWLAFPVSMAHTATARMIVAEDVERVIAAKFGKAFDKHLEGVLLGGDVTTSMGSSETVKMTIEDVKRAVKELQEAADRDARAAWVSRVDEAVRALQKTAYDPPMMILRYGLGRRIGSTVISPYISTAP